MLLICAGAAAGLSAQTNTGTPRPRTNSKKAIIQVSATDALTSTFQIPPDAAHGQTIHALLQVTGNGTPPLTSLQRVVVTVVAR
jgi:hypothetical protein